MNRYDELCEALSAMTNGVPYRVANLGNAASLLFYSLESLNWAGFYLIEGGKLVLGPFQGKTACIEIAIGKGVCGTAVAKNETQLVYDVHEFPGHIACDCASNSEIVIPIRKNGEIIGVLDIDSPIVGRFTDDDKDGLERFVRVLEENVF